MPPTASLAARSLLRGLSLRCPACGAGRLSRSRLALFHWEDRCGACGVGFEPGRGEFTGALMLGMGLFGMIALMGFFVLHVFFDVPDAWELAWLLFFGGVFPVLAYRHVKGAWVGLMHAANGLGPGGAPTE